jgi:hypothetical protein
MTLGANRLLVNCVFTDLRNPSLFGGAIHSDSSLRILYCSFTRVSASSGGAISCDGDLATEFSAYVNISVTGKYGLFRLVEGSQTVSIDSDLAHTVATAGHACFRKFGGILRIGTTNFTGFSADKYLPGFESGSNEASVSFSLFEAFRARSRIGGISFWQCSHFNVTAHFVNLSIGQGRSDDAIVAWLDGSLQQGAFWSCCVISSVAPVGRLIYGQESQRVEIWNCRFCMPRKQAVSAKTGIVIHDNCVFDVQTFEPVPVMRVGRVDFGRKGPQLAWSMASVFVWTALGSAVIIVWQLAVKL